MCWNKENEAEAKDRSKPFTKRMWETVRVPKPFRVSLVPWGPREVPQSWLTPRYILTIHLVVVVVVVVVVVAVVVVVVVVVVVAAVIIIVIVIVVVVIVVIVVVVTVVVA